MGKTGLISTGEERNAGQDKAMTCRGRPHKNSEIKSGDPVPEKAREHRCSAWRAQAHIAEDVPVQRGPCTPELSVFHRRIVLSEEQVIKELGVGRPGYCPSLRGRPEGAG